MNGQIGNDEDGDNEEEWEDEDGNEEEDEESSAVEEEGKEDGTDLKKDKKNKSSNKVAPFMGTQKQLEEDEILDYDNKAYEMLHRANTEWYFYFF